MTLSAYCIKYLHKNISLNEFYHYNDGIVGIINLLTGIEYVKTDNTGYESNNKLIYFTNPSIAELDNFSEFRNINIIKNLLIKKEDFDLIPYIKKYNINLSSDMGFENNLNIINYIIDNINIDKNWNNEKNSLILTYNYFNFDPKYIDIYPIIFEIYINNKLEKESLINILNNNYDMLNDETNYLIEICINDNILKLVNGYLTLNTKIFNIYDNE